MASRPTKYAHVVKDLPKYLGETPERLQLLDGLRNEILEATERPEDWNLQAQLFSGAAHIQDEVQQLLELAKRGCRGKKNAAAIAAAYVDARTVLDAISEWRSSAQLLVDAYERLMTDQMEAEELRSMHLESGASVSTYSEPYGQVVDKEAFRLWCVAPSDKCMDCGGQKDAPWHSHEPSEDPQVHHYHPGGGYERQLQLWPSTMNSIAKERTLAGVPPPDGVEVTAKLQVRVNKP